MVNNKRKFTLEIEALFKGDKAKENAKSLGKDITSILENIGKSGDAMDYFRELVQYIGLIDSELSAFRAAHSDDFDKIFSGLDSNLQQQLEGIFQTTKANLTTIDQLRRRITDTETKIPKEGVKSLDKSEQGVIADEAKKIKSDIESLYADLGKPITISNRLGPQKMLAEAKTYLNDFAREWDGVNERVARGLGIGVGGTGTGSAGGSNSITDELDEMSQNIKNSIRELEDQIEKLKEQKEGLTKILNDSQNIKSDDVDLSVDSVRKLVDEYETLSNSIKNVDHSSDEYYNSLARIVEVSSKMNTALKKLKQSDDSVKEIFRNTVLFEGEGVRKTLFGQLAAGGGDQVYKDWRTRAKNKRDTYNIAIDEKTTQIRDLKVTEAQIEQNKKLGLSYKSLAKYAVDYMNISSKVGRGDTLTNDDEKLMSQIAKDLKAFAKAKKIAMQDLDDIFAKAETGRFTDEDSMLKELCNTLGVQIPQNAQKAKDAVKDLGDTKITTGADSTKPDANVESNVNKIKAETDVHKANISLIEDEVAAKDKLGNIIQDDDVDDIARENGKLEEKLELLREIANAYGSNITNAKLNRYEDLNQKEMNDGLTYKEEDRFSELGDEIEEADSNLKEFGATYDKIILKFVKGKDKDILPDYKGLRDLYKYADSFDYDEFNGKEIKDVIFTRKQEQAIIEQTNQDLQEQVSIQKGVNEVSDNKPNKEVTAEIEEQNEALQRQKALYEYIEKANKEKRKVSETTLGVTDAVYEDFDEDYNLVEKSTLDIIKEKQKVLKQYLNELVQIEQQERENGQLTEKEIARHEELVRLIREMQLSVRYKDGTNYSTSKFNSDEIEQLNEIVNLRKKIDIGYYSTGNYGTIADTYNGINISDLLDEGSRSFDWDIREFDQSMIGQLVREYQFLHEEILRCLRVGEEVPVSTLDRLKWFESLDSSKLDEIIPKLTELRDKIDVFTSWETGTIDEISGFKYDQDESYYNEKISSLQELLALKKEYISLGGIHDDPDEGWDIEGIQLTLDRMIQLKNGVKDVQKLKSEFSNAHPDINFKSESDYVNILKRLQDGTYSYETALEQMTDAYEKHNEEVKKAEEALRQQEAAQEALNQEKKEEQTRADNTAEEAKENAEAKEREADAHEHNADAIKKENAARAAETDKSSSDEIVQLEKLEEKIKAVKEAVELKTQAFRYEGDVVNQVVSKETIALDTLSKYLDTIYISINNIIDGLNKINNTKLNDVVDDESQAVVNEYATDNTNVDKDNYALDSTLSTTNSILQSILAVVSGDESTNQVTKALEGAIADLKVAADALRTSANEVKQESKKGTKSKPKDDKPTTSKKRGKEDELTFDEIKNNEISNFEKYKKDVENSIHVTDQFKNKLSELELQLKDVNDAEGLSTWKQNVEKFQGAFGIHENANKKQLIGEINDINKDAKDSIKGLDLNELSDDTERRAAQERIIQGFKEIQIASDICTNSVKKNQYDEISAFNAAKQQLAEKKKQLLEEAAIYRQQYGFMNGGKSGKNYGSTAVMRETTRYNKFKQYASDESQGFKDSTLFNEKLQQYINAYDRLIAKRQEISNKSVRTDRDEQEFNDAKQAAADYGKELDKMIAKSNKLISNSYNQGKIGSDIDVEDALSRKKALTDFVTDMHDASESTIKFSNDYQECTFKMKNSEGTFTKMTATLDKTTHKMYSAAGEVTKYKTAFGEFIGSLKGEFLKLGRYMIASFGIQEVIQAVRIGVGYVKEINNALTELKKVTNETDAGYERFLQTMSKTAGVVGSTVAELTTMAAEWARLGYSMQEAADLATSTAVLLNVSEFEDATQASEALISTIQAFSYAADDSMHVVDILNEVKVTCLLVQ